MQEATKLNVSRAYYLRDSILQTKVINNDFYIFDKKNLYKIEGNNTKLIKEDIQYFSNAFDEIKNKILSIHFRDDNKLVYKHETVFETEVELSKKENIKDIFLFYDVGSAAIQFDDSSIDIYLLNNNKNLTNISFNEKIEYIYKSYSAHELIITLENKIIFFDIITLKTKRTFPIDKTNFVGVNYINKSIYIIYKKHIKIIDENFNETTMKLDIDGDISKVFVNHGLNELIIVTDANKILLYHILTNTIFPFYYYAKKIQEIRFIDYDLYIVSKNNVSVTNTTKGDKELEQSLSKKDEKSSLSAIQENPFLLLNNNYYSKIELFWENSFKDISNKSLMNKDEEAKEIFEKFSFINSYKKDYMKILESKDIFLNIIKSQKTLKYDEVFKDLEENPFIKTTSIGKKIIDDWDHLLDKFIEYILRSNFNKNDEAYKKIKKYEADPSKKRLIATIILNKDVLLSTIVAFKNKNFLVYSRLINKYPFLKELPITKKFENISLNIYDKISHYIDTEDFEKATYSIDHLRDFYSFQENIGKLKEKVNVIKGFKSLLERKNIAKCRTLLEQYEEYFHNSPYYYEIIKYDLKDMDLAISRINKGNFDGAYEILKGLFSSNIWADKIKFIMAEYYKEKFKQTLSNLNDYSEGLYVNNFYTIFGYADKIFKKDVKNINNITIKKVKIYPKNILDYV